MRHFVLLLVVTVSLLFMQTGIAAAEPDMKEGQWEITVKMDMPGLPFQMPPMKSTTCITKENLAPQPEQKGQDCTMKDTQIKGNVVTWVVDCKDKKSSTHAEGEVTYHGSGFDGTILMTTNDKNGETQMTQKMSGRFLGPCK